MHILVVDDEIELANALATGLRREGYTVSTAGSLAEAFDAVARRAPRLIILDVLLPDGVGLSLLRTVPDSTGVILISGHATEDIRASLRMPFARCDFLPKPFGLRDILGRVSAMVRSEKSAQDESLYHATVSSYVAAQLLAGAHQSAAFETIISVLLSSDRPIRSAAKLASACGYSRGGLYAVWDRNWHFSPHELVLCGLACQAIDIAGRQAYCRRSRWKYAAERLGIDVRTIRSGLSLLVANPFIGEQIRYELEARGVLP